MKPKFLFFFIIYSILTSFVFADFPLPFIRFRAKTLSEDQIRRRVYALRNQHLSEDYCFRFAFIQIPYRGNQELLSRGYLWGTWTNEGPILRFYIPSTGSEEPLSMLIKSGMNPEVWVYQNKDVRKLSPQELQSPIIKDAIITPFDLQMPFIYWSDLEFEGTKRMKNMHCFSIIAKPNSISTNPNQTLTYNPVRIIVSDKHNALMRVEVLNQDEQVVRTLNVQSMKKIQNQWIIRRLDFSSEATGDTTRLEVNKIALGLSLSSKFFTPDALKTPPLIPDSDDFIHLRN